ncbi:MAG: HEAT repeat domain-containing protein, partial [Thermoanaerobaculia bacterium]
MRWAAAIPSALLAAAMTWPAGAETTGLVDSAASAPDILEGALTAEDVAQLVTQLESEASRPSARRLLLALGRQAVPMLLDHLDHQNPEVRLQLIDILGAIRDPQVSTALARIITHADDPRLRWHAVLALSEVPDRAPILEMLRRDLAAAEEPVSWNAAVGLSWLSADDGLALLQDGVMHRDPWRRWEAITALGRVHDDSTARVLGQVLLSPIRADREEAVLALGKIGNGEAFLLLLAALGDAAPEVRWRACLALGRSGMPEAILP